MTTALVVLLVAGAASIGYVVGRRRAPRHQGGVGTTLFEHSPVGIFKYDAHSRITDCNEAMVRIIGSPRDVLIGLDLSTLKDQRIRPALDEALAGREGLYEGPYDTTTSDRTIWTELRTAPVRDDQGRLAGAVGLVQDRSGQHRLEQQLVRAQKLESVGRLAGGIAHDFKNLLTAISAYADLAGTSIDPQHVAQEDLREIRLTTERATKLVRQLLAFARREPSEPRVLDLNLLIDDLTDLLRRLLGGEVAVETELGSDVGLVRADAGQVEQVLVNLAVNARDATAGGGRVTIRTENHTVDRHTAVHGGLLHPGEYVRIDVQDTGAGMDEEVLQHVFEPFFSTKNPEIGTGLGLATCFGIVMQNNGRIDVLSRPGAGTTFRVFLPRIDPSSPVPGLIQLPRGTERILLAEDDPETRRLVTGQLESHGYTVVACGDGAEALDRAASPAPDLVVTDLVMPKMGGLDLVGRLRRTRPDLPAVFMSGFEAPPGFPEAFLAKPFTASQLLVEVRTVLDGTRVG